MAWHWFGLIPTKLGIPCFISAAKSVYGFTLAIRAGELRMSSKRTNGSCLFTYSAAFAEYCGPVKPALGIDSGSCRAGVGAT